MLLHLASFSAFLKIPEVLRPAAAATRLGPGPTASSSDQGSQGVEIFEVACKKPLGLQLREKPGRGVEVALVYEGSKAAQLGVRAGDLIVATSASLGSQMWEKKTLAGVESAIQTRVDGIVRLRLRRERAERWRSRWEDPVKYEYEVSLTRPIGLVLRPSSPSVALSAAATEAAAPEPVGAATAMGDSSAGGQSADERPPAGAEVAEVVEGGSAAASGAVRVGDVVVATSASVGDSMWRKSSVEGITAAISTRLSLSGSVRLRLSRSIRLGRWAVELDPPPSGQPRRRRLSAAALSSYRQQLGELRSAPLPVALADAIRRICARAVRPPLGRMPIVADGERGADARAVCAVLRRLRSARVALDARLANGLMGTALRADDAQLALRVFDELVDGGGAPNAQVFTTLIKAHGVAGQRQEAVAVLQRMRAQGVPPTVRAYNAAMAVRARGGDRRGMMELFAAISADGLRPTVASWNAVLLFCKEQRLPELAEEVLRRMRRAAMTPDAFSYACVTQACVQRGRLERARELVDEMQAAGIPADAFILNTLLGGYAKQLRWTEALRTFNKLTSGGTAADLLSYSLLLRACVRARQPAQGAVVLERARAAGFAPNARMYTLLLAAHAQEGEVSEALELFQQMQASGVPPTRHTFGALMEACIVVRQPAPAQALFAQMEKAGIAADVVTHTLLLRALATHPTRSSLERGVALLEQMSAEGGDATPNALSFNALLDGCARSAQHDLALVLLRRMLRMRVSPTRRTFSHLALEPAAMAAANGGGGAAGSSAGSTAAAESQLRFLLDVVEIFEEYRRPLGGAVYSALLRCCTRTGEVQTAEALVAKRHGGRLVVLRRAEMEEVSFLEKAALRAN